MDTRTKNSLAVVASALVVGGFIVSPAGRKLVSRAKWRLMSAEKRYAYLWERTKESLYSTPSNVNA